MLFWYNRALNLPEINHPNHWIEKLYMNKCDVDIFGLYTDMGQLIYVGY